MLLARWLIGPLLLLIILSGIFAYLTAIDAARNAYDSALLDPAIAIAGRLRIDDERIEVGLSKTALDALRVDSVDRMYFQVLGPYGQRVAGNARIPLPSSDPTTVGSGHVFFDGVIQGQRVRIAALGLPHARGRILVQVAETLIKRNRLVKNMLLSTLIPEALFALAAITLFWFGIRRGLKPLERLREQITLRSTADLHPVEEDDKPVEIRPLVAALNRLLAQLSGAIESRRRFMANAAHQLRTPLAGLRTHADLARNERDPEELRALLDMIAGETERTTHLVNQLLALGRAEPGGKPALQHDPVNLRDVAHNAAKFWVSRALAKDIDLGFELEDAWTRGDATLLGELLANLIDNAIAYTDAEGVVTVRTTTHGSGACLEVEDNGIGIPESERARVFERFYRISGSRGEGCGLGLSIVAEIADRHQATVQINHASSGRGTCVRVVFKTMERAAVDI